MYFASVKKRINNIKIEGVTFLMTKKYVMALDAGTTSNRAIIFDQDSNIIAVAQKEFTQIFLRLVGLSMMLMKSGAHKLKS